MHSEQGVEMYKAAVEEAVAKGGKIEFGGKVRAVFTLTLQLNYNC